MRSTRGFSIAEALVALLIVAIVLVAAGAIFTAIGKRTDRESERAPGIGGPTDVALDRLERDLQLAVAFPQRGAGLEAGGRTLLLEMDGGGLVTWRQEGTVLLRGTEDDRLHLVEKKLLDRMLLAEFHPRGESLFDVALRRRDEPLRMRTVLVRNAIHGTSNEGGASEPAEGEAGQ